MTEEEKRALVLELFAEDVLAGLDTAVAEKRQTLVKLVEGVWDKYRVTLAELRNNRGKVESRLDQFLKMMRYV